MAVYRLINLEKGRKILNKIIKKNKTKEKNFKDEFLDVLFNSGL
jgi:hypothetical protein